MRLLYTEEGQLLYSRDWPEIPEIESSIYQDQMAMNAYNDKMKVLMKSPCPVINTDKAFIEIILQCGELQRGRFYDITNDFKIISGDIGYKCEVL
jgi:hypothetical protein